MAFFVVLSERCCHRLIPRKSDRILRLRLHPVAPRRTCVLRWLVIGWHSQPPNIGHRCLYRSQTRGIYCISAHVANSLRACCLPFCHPRVTVASLKSTLLQTTYPHTFLVMSEPTSQKATNSGIQRLSNGSSVIPSSTRADGSVRREIKVKPGYKPPEEEPRQRRRPWGRECAEGKR
jgi:hypothetical protein